jgi:putative copper export protein
LFVVRKVGVREVRDMLDATAHTLHVILAGAWLGGVVFTTTVVSPALKSMGWDEAEQARMRSVIGRQYAKVGTANLVLLLVFALLEGTLSGFGPALYSEYALLAVLFGLVASHGAYFGRRLWSWLRLEKGPGIPKSPKCWLSGGGGCRGSPSESPC